MTGRTIYLSCDFTSWLELDLWQRYLNMKPPNPNHTLGTSFAKTHSKTVTSPCRPIRQQNRIQVLHNSPRCRNCLHQNLSNQPKQPYLRLEIVYRDRRVIASSGEEVSVPLGLKPFHLQNRS
ncbi:hypothetical protein Ae201684P_021128 [Aphanomyces euteiches]|uniref:Uncharacterized protein n=1 Tax=Aphanomyces euteiches TaxID=100861 RepID=A0A6G0WGV6_9STRA|nr:hypothetical protein Ae201684_015344 [Aphanomyces euteiches]KAH9071991.1 hypothetical protein Ae201684P_021128 [Aphanomyces euteiches]